MPGCVAEAGEVKIVKDLGDGLTITNHRDGTELCMTGVHESSYMVQHNDQVFEVRVIVQHSSPVDDRVERRVRSLAAKIGNAIEGLRDRKPRRMSLSKFRRSLGI
jgi:hypothetical protein